MLNERDKKKQNEIRLSILKDITLETIFSCFSSTNRDVQELTYQLITKLLEPRDVSINVLKNEEVICFFLYKCSILDLKVFEYRNKSSK